MPKFPDNLSKSHFDFNMIVGRGGFGEVWIVNLKNQRRFYALKKMNKAKILMKKSVESIMSENLILESLSHKFIINKKASFQDRNYLYLLMDLATGGDLRFHMCMQKGFSET